MKENDYQDLSDVHLLNFGDMIMSGVEKGQILAYKKEGLSSREIARKIDRSPFVVNNFLKLGNT